jgi:hypothetical protein
MSSPPYTHYQHLEDIFSRYGNGERINVAFAGQRKGLRKMRDADIRKCDMEKSGNNNRNHSK